MNPSVTINGFADFVPTGSHWSIHLRGISDDPLWGLRDTNPRFLDPRRWVGKSMEISVLMVIWNMDTSHLWNIYGTLVHGNLASIPQIARKGWYKPSIYMGGLLLYY